MPNELFLVAFTGVVFFFTGYYIGVRFCNDVHERRRQAEEEELKKQQMWNDYLKAIGGQYER
jgi:hypothetical protein